MRPRPPTAFHKNRPNTPSIHCHEDIDNETVIAENPDESRSSGEHCGVQLSIGRRIYFHPLTQVAMLGLVFFMCPGLFNALNGLGAGGQVDSTTSANSNAAHYAVFSFSAFFSGPINNKLGSRLTLFLGSIGYAVYIGSYLTVNIHPNAGGFVIAAGAVQGICAGMLWAAQGSLMLSYPTESQKGKFIGVFWAIFNMGAVIGAIVSLAQNFNSKSNSVGNGTYIAFLAVTLSGVLIPLVMADSSKVTRTAGSKVPTARNPTWKKELYGLWVVLQTDPMIILLFPMFFSSNWFYTWQFNDFNGAVYNIRARSLNNLMYWIAQIFGALGMGVVVDKKNMPRRTRAFAAWSIVFILSFVAHIWAYLYQRGYTRESIPPDASKMDIRDPAFIGRISLYTLFGVLDAVFQSFTFWLIGAMSNDPAKLAHFSGIYKSIQSAGAAGVWRLDAIKRPYMTIFISTWVLVSVSLIMALPLILLRIRENSDVASESDIEISGISEKEATSKYCESAA